MPTTDSNRLLTAIQTRLPGALNDALLLGLFDAVDEFLTETNLWQEDIEVVANAGQTEYALVPSAGKVVRILASTDASGAPVAFVMPVPGTATPLVSPTQDTTYTFRVALSSVDPQAPTAVPEIPDWIYTYHREALMHGTLQRMMSQPSKPYSNNTMAVYHGRMFKAAQARARASLSQMNVRGAQAWRFPQTFNRRGR